MCGTYLPGRDGGQAGMRWVSTLVLKRKNTVLPHRCLKDANRRQKGLSCHANRIFLQNTATTQSLAIFASPTESELAGLNGTAHASGMTRLYSCWLSRQEGSGHQARFYISSRNGRARLSAGKTERAEFGQLSLCTRLRYIRRWDSRQCRINLRKCSSPARFSRSLPPATSEGKRQMPGGTFTPEV